MSIPTTVFIVANAKRQVRAGYTKDMEVTLDLIRKGNYQPGWETYGKLIYREDVASVREAIARVNQIEGMSPAEVGRLIDKVNPGRLGMFADGRIGDWSTAPQAKLHWVYVIGNDEFQAKVGYTSDLLGTLRRLRSQWLHRRHGADGTERLVYHETATGRSSAGHRARQIARLGRQGIVEFVRSFNPGWSDETPSSMLGTAIYRPSTRGGLGEDGGSSSGGVSAVLPGGPRSPRGTRAAGNEEPWPPEEPGSQH